MSVIETVTNVRKKNVKEIVFLLCESCFWCASYFVNKKFVLAGCPGCKSDKIQFLPLAFDESEMRYGHRREVVENFDKVSPRGVDALT